MPKNAADRRSLHGWEFIGSAGLRGLQRRSPRDRGERASRGEDLGRFEFQDSLRVLGAQPFLAVVGAARPFDASRHPWALPTRLGVSFAPVRRQAGSFILILCGVALVLFSLGPTAALKPPSPLPPGRTRVSFSAARSMTGDLRPSGRT
jgi:hypothetical protein